MTQSVEFHAFCGEWRMVEFQMSEMMLCLTFGFSLNLGKTRVLLEASALGVWSDVKIFSTQMASLACFFGLRRARNKFFSLAVSLRRMMSIPTPWMPPLRCLCGLPRRAETTTACKQPKSRPRSRPSRKVERELSCCNISTAFRSERTIMIPRSHLEQFPRPFRQ